MLLATALLPAATLAQDEDCGEDCAKQSKGEIARQDIIVTANRVEQDAKTTGQAVTIIDSETIETRQTINVAELLATTPGISVARNGGSGGVTSLFMRGAGSDSTLVLIDGVRVNDPASPSGAFDFANLQTAGIERIEVVRGANSIVWGSQAIGGVVNILTATPRDGFSVRANAEYGDYKTAQAGGTIGYGSESFKASLGGGYFRTAGISHTDTQPDRDKNNQYQITGRAELKLAEGFTLEGRSYYGRSFAELDGFNPTSLSKQFSGYGGVRAEFGSVNLRAAYSLANIRRDYTSSFGPSFFSGRSERAEAQADWQAADWVRIIAGFESEWTRARNTFFTGSRRTRLSSLYGQLLLTPVEGLNLAGGVRHDDHRSFGGETSFGANMAYNFGGTTLRASYAESFRAPSLDELFASYGNIGLTPERARGYDIGVEQTLLDDRVLARLTWFGRKTRDEITFFFCSTNPNPLCAGRGPFGAYYLNIDKTKADGIEAELILKPTERLTFNANYSYIRSENRSGPNIGRDLPRRPRNLANVSVDWAAGRFSLGSTISLVGDSFDNASNSARIDGHFLVGLRGSVNISDALSLYGRVENLTDADYETVRNFNTYGRNAHVGLRVRF